jgi:protein-tyrosine phosphatase
LTPAILFVCTANICRSPMAEGVLRRMSPGGKGVTCRVASAGTHDYHAGEPAFPIAVGVAKRRGYDISRHIARCITPGDIERYDVILAMDRFNLESVRQIAPTSHKGKIELLLEYGDAYRGQEVPDPYGGPVADFELALDRIEDACRGIVGTLVR